MECWEGGIREEEGVGEVEGRNGRRGDREGEGKKREGGGRERGGQGE